jgi:glutamate 5-kinase
MTLVVKLGSSIVAADDGELRTDVLDSICKQVCELRQGGERVVMVTSGAIALGRRTMQLTARPKVIDELQAASAVGQGDLFRAYESRLARRGAQAAQVLVTGADLAERTSYVNARRTLVRLVNWNVVPVINENDTTSTDEITFGDNDFLAALVAMLMEARLLVLLTNTEGLYSADPRTSPEAQLIQWVESFAELEEFEINERASTFGSGGMKSKVFAAEMASEAGIPAVICNGTREGTLAAAARGEVGTRFHAHLERASGFKLWLKYAKPDKGIIVVDDGAAHVLREKGSSLLPVGIQRVEGRFGAGDAVLIVLGEEVIGKGISGYSSGELRQILGLKSSQARELIPDAPDEVVHRDRFVLL